MGSNYFGSDANGRSCVAGMSSSSRSKGKKNGSDKPKRPQRGLGVAQLEKIRLHDQMECNYLPTFHNPFAQNFIQEDMGLQTSPSSPSYGFPGSYRAMMGLPDFEGATTYGESQPSNVARTWQPGNAGLKNHHFVLPNSMTRSFFDHGVEGSFNRKKKEVGPDLFAYTKQNSDHQSSNSQDIDLELRL
ncbi:protein SPEAR1-like [Primulina huaijiensis]|uniref:protein SPEAR1-like n=1 Tax=Primulina huaijiensis TaxID=1492673 RepID=UPI003CC73746